MAFLDNSGDIILDVVLTDEGRKRLAQGDGSFQIAKFALGDDEINYDLYNPTGSTGQKAVQILQTPILEAFTNNMSSMKSTLMTYGSNDLFHLPVLKVNPKNSGNEVYPSTPSVHMVAVDFNTADNAATVTPATSVGLDANGNNQNGVLNGADPSSGPCIRVDAGIDNVAEPPSNRLTGNDMAETSYEIKIDHRLGEIVSRGGEVISFIDIDDDNVATYVVTAQTAVNSAFVTDNTQTNSSTATQIIAGSRSTTLQFGIASSASLRSSFYLFDLIGSEAEMTSPANLTGASGTNNVKIIDSIVRVTGQITGYSVDIPVRFVKNI